MVDRGVFEQEGWQRDEDGTVSGVVYNEMQGALATPDAQLQNALSRAMFPDTAYGFVSGGDPASIPALTYEKYVRVYRRHYSADNCCITLYGKMDMAEKLAFLDEQYLSHMPKSVSRPRLTVQDEQAGVRLHIPYYTEKPEPDEAQCALAWYTGAFADRERQLGVEILLDALLGNNQSPLKAALLEEKLGADIDVGFDDSTLQPTLELVLRGATEASAGKFAAAVRNAVDGILEKGIPEELLMASLNSTEFASLERPGSIPDGVLDAIHASTGWLHTGDPALLLHTNGLFASLREKLEKGWFNELLRELFAPAPVEVIQVPALPKKEEEGRAARTDGKLVLDHPLTAADLGEGKKLTPGRGGMLAGAELLHHPSAGSTYLNFYYDIGNAAPEEMPYLNLLTDVVDELDTGKHTAQELNTLRNTWLGRSGAWVDGWTGRQPGRPVHAKLVAGMSLLERSLEKAVELGGEWLYETKLRSRDGAGGQPAEADDGAEISAGGPCLCVDACGGPLLGGGRHERAVQRRELLSLPLRAAGRSRLGRTGPEAGRAAAEGAGRERPDGQSPRQRCSTGHPEKAAARQCFCGRRAPRSGALHRGADGTGERGLRHRRRREL